MRSYFHLLTLLLIFVCSYCSPKEKTVPAGISLDKSFPRWLKHNSTRTDQTSGISFIGKNKKNEKIFLLADDVGKIHHLNISSDMMLTITPIQFSSEAIQVFIEYPKLDFEEIFYDLYSNDVYISVEGNGKLFLEQTAIFKVIFKNKNVFENEIINFEKVIFEPQAVFRKYISSNIGYEGFTADSKYFYLGLEGRIGEKGFADSTFIFVAEKSTKKIIKIISTKSISMQTICGLYSDADLSLWSVDRNNRRLFYLRFDEEFNLISNNNWHLDTQIPGYKNYLYTASFEGITISDENIYLVDDPWHQFFIPQESVLDSLDAETILNFRNFIPVIYKFNLIK